MTDPIEINIQDSVEKQKLLYDLTYKQWENFFSNLPEINRGRITGMIPVYAVTIAFIPTFLKVIIHESDVELLSLLALISLLFLTLSIFCAAKVLYVKIMPTFNPSELGKAIANKTLLSTYKNVIHHLDTINVEILKIHQRMATFYQLAFISFFVSIIAGIIAYSIVFLR
jgi:hypothetical protein